jgi:hypothetical protein
VAELRLVPMLVGFAVLDVPHVKVGRGVGRTGTLSVQTLSVRLPASLEDPNGAARAGGFSPHAGVDIAPHQREKPERLCRYVSRPPVASERLAALVPPPRMHLTRFR